MMFDHILHYCVLCKSIHYNIPKQSQAEQIIFFENHKEWIEPNQLFKWVMCETQLDGLGGYLLERVSINKREDKEESQNQPAQSDKVDYVNCLKKNIEIFVLWSKHLIERLGKYIQIRK